MAERFSGFPRESIEFFKQLAAHNNRDWYLAHKDIYERTCRAPMQALVTELEPRFGTARISRINRDVRFSRYWAPYKTYIAAGVGGNYISLSADGLGRRRGGLYRPDPRLLQPFRAAIDDDTTDGGSRRSWDHCDATATKWLRTRCCPPLHEAMPAITRGSSCCK